MQSRLYMLDIICRLTVNLRNVKTVRKVKKLGNSASSPLLTPHNFSVYWASPQDGGLVKGWIVGAVQNPILSNDLVRRG